MTTTNSPVSTRAESRRILVRVLIIAEGALTLFACFVIFPLGAALALANGAMAIASRGTNRKMFAAISIAGIVVALLVALLLPAVSTAVNVPHHATPL